MRSTDIPRKSTDLLVLLAHKLANVIVDIAGDDHAYATTLASIASRMCAHDIDKHYEPLLSDPEPTDQV